MSDKTINRVAKATPAPVARKIKGLSDRAIAWIFVAPTIFLLLAINIFPLIWTIRLSFTNYKANRINREPEWIGLRNYERILTDSDIWLNMQATAHFLIWTIFFQVLIGFTLSEQYDYRALSAGRTPDRYTRREWNDRSAFRNFVCARCGLVFLIIWFLIVKP